MIVMDSKVNVKSFSEANKVIKLIANKLPKVNEVNYSKFDMESKNKGHVLIMEKDISTQPDKGFFIFKYLYGNINLNSTMEFFDISVFTR